MVPGDLEDLHPTKPPACPPQTQIDLDVLAAKIVLLIPKPADGVDGQPGPMGPPGQPGRGISSTAMLLGANGSPTGIMRITYTDGTIDDLPEMGITVKLWDIDGKLSDSEFVPLGGTLNLEQTIKGVE